MALDLEDPKMTLKPEEFLEWILEFKKVINNAERKLIIYSSRSYLNERLPTNHSLGNIPLWLAVYPNTVNLNSPPKPPKGWKDWVIWQYSEKGKPAGFTSGLVDLNVMTEEFFHQY